MNKYEGYTRAINEIRKKWENAEQLVISCDPRSVYALSEVDLLLEKHKQYKHGREVYYQKIKKL